MVVFLLPIIFSKFLKIVFWDYFYWDNFLFGLKKLPIPSLTLKKIVFLIWPKLFLLFLPWPRRPFRRLTVLTRIWNNIFAVISSYPYPHSSLSSMLGRENFLKSQHWPWSFSATSKTYIHLSKTHRPPEFCLFHQFKFESECNQFNRRHISIEDWAVTKNMSQ